VVVVVVVVGGVVAYTRTFDWQIFTWSTLNSIHAFGIL